MLRTDTVVADRYRLISRIAEGGMGSVWAAWDERLHRKVALKRLHRQPELTSADTRAVRERAMREARITARLHHAHAVQVYDVVDVEGQPCLVMEYLPSRSLSAVISEQRILPLAQVARIGAEVGAALAAAHRVGIVHRDVKPGNVLIDESGSAKITDFGISHALGDVTLTSTGMVTGTPAFLAPEVARGERSTPASDVFSLGATLYAALEGEPPFGAGDNPMATLHRVASGRVNPPRRSGPLTPLLHRMLALAPASRPHMESVVRELCALQARLDKEDRTVPVAAADPADRTTRNLARGTPLPSRTLALPPARPPARPPTAAAAPPPRPPVAAAPVPSAIPVPAAGSRRRRRWWPMIAALAVALVVGGVAAAIALTGNSPAPPAHAGKRPAKPPATTTSHQPHRVSHSSTTSPEPHRVSHSSTRPTSPPPSVPSTAPTTPSEQPTATSTQPQPPPAVGPTAQQLAAAIVDYYGLLPGDTADAWPRLTSSYQRSTAGGRANYDSFWNEFSAVSATDVTATPPGTVVATINYVRRDGTTTSERTSFGLVPRGGQLKIDSSYVISSR